MRAHAEPFGVFYRARLLASFTSRAPPAPRGKAGSFPVSSRSTGGMVVAVGDRLWQIQSRARRACRRCGSSTPRILEARRVLDADSSVEARDECLDEGSQSPPARSRSASSIIGAAASSSPFAGASRPLRLRSTTGASLLRPRRHGAFLYILFLRPNVCTAFLTPYATITCLACVASRCRHLNSQSPRDL